MQKISKTVLLTFLMVILGLSAATNSLNESTETTVLDEISAPQEVILPQISLNQPGFQEGSIFSDSTISGGHLHTCAILDNGEIACWGDGRYGKLGICNLCLTDKMYPTLTASLGDGRSAISVSIGSVHTCAILDNGEVSCWGDGSNGRLGDGGTSMNPVPTLTNSLGAGRTAVAISSGNQHTCVILDNGAVSCWGGNSYGQLGDGTTTDRHDPTPTSTLGTGRTAIAISAGNAHTCALLDNGSVSCWGSGANGRLGDGSTSDSLTPTLTSSMGENRHAIGLAAGGAFTCALLDNGSVACWGLSSQSQLGNNSFIEKSTPTQTASLGTNRHATAISAGGSHACALLDDNSISCWGYGTWGQLGNGINGRKDIPTPVNTFGSNPANAAYAIATGTDHTCAIYGDGNVSCWGRGDDGRLGVGGTDSKSIPWNTRFLLELENRSAALSERDFDGNGDLNIF